MGREEYLLIFLKTILIIFLCAGCRPAEKHDSKAAWDKISGRDEEPLSGLVARAGVYRARVPMNWKRIDPSPEKSLYDSTLSLCEYFIEDTEGRIIIAVHNFPNDSNEERIPPIAQTNRWVRQIAPCKQETVVLSPQSHGGFYGFYLQAEGIKENRAVKILGWAMQLGMEQYQNLVQDGTSTEKALYKQMRADYTIKAWGEPGLVERHREQIEQFARSFELIGEIPLS